MKKQVAWQLGIVGLALLVIGLISVTAANMTVETLMIYFGTMLLIVGGVEALLCILMRKKLTYWPWLAFVSLLFIVIGYYMFKNSLNAQSKFNLLIATWAVLVGVVQLVLSFRNKQARVFLVSMGIISLFFGAMIYMNPFRGPNTIQFMVGFYTLLLSFFILYMAFRMLRNRPVASS